MIHIEQQWEENLWTIEGDRMHEKAHGDALYEKRGNLLITRGITVASPTYGVTGTCDIVEFYQDKDGIDLFGRTGKYCPVPVEYKHGQPKENNADRLQLCLQAMCLEESLVCDIKKGYIYYGQTKHRTEVVFDEGLRNEVKAALKEMHTLYHKRYTPIVKPTSRCRACSLATICLPKILKSQTVTQYINQHAEEAP